MGHRLMRRGSGNGFAAKAEARARARAAEPTKARPADSYRGARRNAMFQRPAKGNKRAGTKPRPWVDTDPRSLEEIWAELDSIAD